MVVVRNSLQRLESTWHFPLLFDYCLRNAHCYCVMTGTRKGGAFSNRHVCVWLMLCPDVSVRAFFVEQ